MVNSLSLGTDRFLTSLIENGAQLEALLHGGASRCDHRPPAHPPARPPT